MDERNRGHLLPSSDSVDKRHFREFACVHPPPPHTHTHTLFTPHHKCRGHFAAWGFERCIGGLAKGMKSRFTDGKRFTGPQYLLVEQQGQAALGLQPLSIDPPLGAVIKGEGR